MICNVEFVLNERRVTALELGGVTTIRGLYRVLDALDLRAVLKLEPRPVPPVKEEIP